MVRLFCISYVYTVLSRRFLLFTTIVVEHKLID